MCLALFIPKETDLYPALPGLKLGNSHYFLSLFFCCVGGVTEDAPMVILLVTTTTKFNATVSGHSKCAAMILHTESLAIELSLTVRDYSQPAYVT